MKSALEITALFLAVSVLTSGLPFSAVSVKAQSQKIVYVAQMVDCEMWGGHDQYLGSSNPHPTIDLRAYARSPPSTVSQVMDSGLRSALTDSFGNSFKVTWFAEMDYLMAQGVFVYANGSSARVSGYTAIYDILEANWGSQIATYGDSIEYHHHFMIYDGTWQRYDNGPDAGYGNYQNYALDHMIIDRNFYPSCFDAGWTIMPDVLSNWLDKWMPFDYTYLGSTGIWYPVHPSGHTRWATQTDDFASQSGVYAAFATAESRGSALYCFTMHDREDMYGNITATHAWLEAAKSAYPDVSFEYVTTSQAIQLALGWSDFAPPTFTVSYNSALGTYYVRSGEALWANHPYVALKYSNGTYVHMEATQAGTNFWSVTPPSGMLQRIGFAASDLSGNPGVWVDTPMSVTVSPTNVEMDVGQSRQFSSSVSGGTSPYSYQWYLNGSPFPGATGSTWTFIPSSSGQYNVYVNVTDSHNLIISSNTATINVHSQLSVTISPASVNMKVGATQQFTSAVTGGLTPYTYQWYYTNGTAITGATTSTLTFKANSTGTYTIYLNVTDNLNYKTQSNTATINVYSQPTATITPTSVNMTVGATQQFTSAVTGGLTPYTYQWYQNDTAVSGATASTWNFTPNATGNYRVYLNVTDALNSKVQSNIVTDITVNPQPTVTISPTSVNMTVGGSQTFSSTITGGTTPYSYQWYQNSTAVTGATSASWTFNPTTAGTYTIYLNVTDNSAITVESNTATAKVETSMAVTISPTQVKMYFGQSQTFSSSVSGGSSPYAYQWYLNDTAVPGATSLNWTFTPMSAGNYKVYLNVTDDFNFRVQSNVSDVLVCSVYLLLTAEPSQGSYVKGQSVTFTVNVFNQLDPALGSSLTLTVTGPSNYGYFDVQPISVPAGTVGEYSFVWVVPDAAGTYMVEVGLAPAQLTAYDTAWLKLN